VTEVAVVGAGNGGLAAAADLAGRDHKVRLYNRSPEPLEAIERNGGIRVTGSLGDNVASLQTTTTSLDEAVEGADAIVVVLPATAHAAIARALRDTRSDAPIILNPGHVCGSLNVRRALRPARPLAELGTLTYVSRSTAPGAVEVYLRATGIPYAATPVDNATAALVDELFPDQRRASHPMQPWFWDVNLALHPPGMILGAARIEATSGDFHFYGNGVTASVEAVMARLDNERVGVARGFGIEIPSLAETMAAIGTADGGAAREGRLGDAIRGGAANAAIKAPPGLDHRYLHEDIPFGLVPLAALGRIAGAPTPVADALIELAQAITGRAYKEEGLNERVLGIVGATVEEVVAMAEGRA
jgi:opine dehydrogenase